LGLGHWICRILGTGKVRFRANRREIGKLCSAQLLTLRGHELAHRTRLLSGGNAEIANPCLLMTAKADMTSHDSFRTLKTPPPGPGSGAREQVRGNQLAFSDDSCSVSKCARNLAMAPASGGPLFVTSFTSSSKYCSWPGGDTSSAPACRWHWRYCEAYPAG